MAKIEICISRFVSPAICFPRILNTEGRKLISFSQVGRTSVTEKQMLCSCVGLWEVNLPPTLKGPPLATGPWCRKVDTK